MQRSLLCSLVTNYLATGDKVSIESKVFSVLVIFQTRDEIALSSGFLQMKPYQVLWISNQDFE